MWTSKWQQPQRLKSISRQQYSENQLAASAVRSHMLFFNIRIKCLMIHGGCDAKRHIIYSHFAYQTNERCHTESYINAANGFCRKCFWLLKHFNASERTHTHTHDTSNNKFNDEPTNRHRHHWLWAGWLTHSVTFSSHYQTRGSPIVTVELPCWNSSLSPPPPSRFGTQSGVDISKCQKWNYEEN